MIMKKRFKTKKEMKKIKRIMFLLFALVGFFLSYLFLYYRIKNNLTSEEYLNYLLKTGFNNQIDRTFITSSIVNINSDKDVSLIENNVSNDGDNVVKTDKPLVYIYSTHDTEGYATSYLNVYNIKPDVKIGSMYLKEKLNDLGVNTIVENRKISDILKANEWAYRYSYKASRIYLEDTYKNNPTLKYFIDFHRDSSVKSRTTTTIDGKDYAKVMFLIGLEHDNYQANLDLATKINDKIKAKYPTLTRGIYKKSGPGVNGIYNQDFNENCLLIEMGGQYNNILEVSNTIDILSKIIYEVINEEN